MVVSILVFVMMISPVSTLTKVLAAVQGSLFIQSMLVVVQKIILGVCIMYIYRTQLLSMVGALLGRVHVPAFL